MTTSVITPARQVLFSIVTLVIALLCFEYTGIDTWLQNFFFNSESGTWLLDSPGKIVSFVFYDGIKKLLILFAVVLLVCLLFFKRAALITNHRKGIRIIFLSLIIVPSVIGGLKATTNVACPRDTVIYGGDVPHIQVFESYPIGGRPEERQRCFPAGHASGGFALMALYYLFHAKRNRRRGLYFGLLIGWLMGGYKMILGHHFISHTIITMIIAWLLINLIVMTDAFVAYKKRHMQKGD